MLSLACALRFRYWHTTTAALLSILFVAGCTYSGGEFLYLMGFGRGAMIDAKYILSDGPLMIFVDDFHERLDLPMAGRSLFDHLSQELLKNKAAKKIIPLNTMEQLRQSVPNFEQKSCREIGELAGAQQVLWIEVKDFLAEEQIFDAHNAAYFMVSVKVINAHEKKSRMRVRLWPRGLDGKTVTVTMTGSEASIAKSKKEISKELCKRLSVSIAKLFYDHRAGDFEREP